ncbi:MAG: glycosyltransferase [Actinomycetes bacterium]
MDASSPAEQPLALSIVIPAYDELPNLRELLPRIATTVGAIPGVNTEILVIVPTVTAEPELAEIAGLGARAIARKPTDAFGDAIRSGIAAVSPVSDHVIIMDADGSHDPVTIPRLLQARQGAHVVVASRYTHGGTTDNTFSQRTMSRILNYTYSVILGIKCRDVSTNYKLYRNADLQQVVLASRDFDIVEEMMCRIKSLHGRSFVVREVPDHFYERNHGQTKRRLGPFIVSYLTTLVRLRWQTRRGGQ